MAKPNNSGNDDTTRQVWISDDVRQQLKAEREKKGWSQRYLAGRIGTTSGTISNVERGAQRTLDIQVYARWRRVLLKEGTSVPEDVWDRLFSTFRDIDEDEAEKLIAMAPIIRTKRK